MRVELIIEGSKEELTDFVDLLREVDSEMEHSDYEGEILRSLGEVVEAAIK